jgi:hypothetical protein
LEFVKECFLFPKQVMDVERPLTGEVGEVDGNQPPFIIESPEIGEQAREKRRTGRKPKKNAGWCR